MWCTSTRCHGLRPRQPDPAGSTYKSSESVQINGASSLCPNWASKEHFDSKPLRHPRTRGIGALWGRPIFLSEQRSPQRQRCRSSNADGWIRTFPFKADRRLYRGHEGSPPKRISRSVILSWHAPPILIRGTHHKIAHPHRQPGRAGQQRMSSRQRHMRIAPDRDGEDAIAYPKVPWRVPSKLLSWHGCQRCKTRYPCGVMSERRPAN